MWAFVEFWMYFVMAITAYATAYSIIMMALIFVTMVVMLLTNIVWTIYFKKVINKDVAFQYYKKRKRKTACVIRWCSTIFSFKMTRFYYA